MCKCHICIYIVDSITDVPHFPLQGRPGPPGVAGPQGEKVSQAQAPGVGGGSGLPACIIQGPGWRWGWEAGLGFWELSGQEDLS